jgi:hypothetical protein
MSRIRPLIKACFLGMAILLAAISEAKAQQSSQKDKNTDLPSEEKKANGFGDVMLKLGKGLVKEVSRRLNLEETEIVTVKKEVASDGREKYRVDTGKFSFTVRKKSKPDTTSKK